MSVLRPEIESVVREFESARERLRSLMTKTAGVRWTERPVPPGWSMAECIAHLNLTSGAFVPLLRDGIERARIQGGTAPRRYRRDLAGWFVWSMSGPSARIRVKTAPAFIPSAAIPPRELVAEFERLQDDQMSCATDADGLAIDRVKVASPFNAKIHYSVYSALTILPRHQHRHLWQAEQVWDGIGRRSVE